MLTLLLSLVAKLVAIIKTLPFLAIGSLLTDAEKQVIGQFGSGALALVDPNTQTIPAGVWTPNYAITHTDAGAAAMTGITVPYTTFQGRITVIPGGAFTWTTATNIGLAGTAVVGKALDFVYSPKTGKWYPSYIA